MAEGKIHVLAYLLNGTVDGLTVTANGHTVGPENHTSGRLVFDGQKYLGRVSEEPEVLAARFHSFVLAAIRDEMQGGGFLAIPSHDDLINS